MQDIDIIYMYEHVARELDVACAVKCIAEQHFGIRIELAQWPSGLPRAFKNFCPRIVVLPYCYNLGTCHLVLLEWRKAILFNLAWEQLLSEATRSEKVPSDEFSRKYVMHHAWSDLFANYLQNKGLTKENIFVNGHPAYMLYEEPYRRYFKQRIVLARDYHLDVNRRWIFLPENFARAFYSDDKIEELVKWDGMNRDQAHAMRQFARLTLKDVMKWCVSIASDNNIELIIRPRPATPLNVFKDAVREVIGVIPERMHFIKDGSIREWIMASDIIISSYSTSLIEAAIAGKIAYMLEPYPIPKFLHVEWHDYITRIETQAEFERGCFSPTAVTNHNQLASWARNSMLARGDAIWNLAEFLARLCQGEIKRPPFPNRKIATPPDRLPLPKWAIFEYRRLKYKKSRRKPLPEILDMHQDDQLSQGEIEQRIHKWEHLLADYINGKSYESVQWFSSSNQRSSIA